MKTIITFIIASLFWMAASVIHSMNPDLIVEGSSKDVSGISEMIVENAPTGVFGTKSIKVVYSTSENNKFCIWYVRSYDIPVSIWDAMEKHGELKCK